MSDNRRLLVRLADRLVLDPSTHEIDARGKIRRTISFGEGQLEFWVQRSGDPSAEVDVYVIKFHGVGGRAERSSLHPAECWPRLNIEVWTVNLPGYGGSTGPASLQPIPAAARAAFEAVAEAACGRPIIAAGNSLGGAAALHVAATCNISGLIVRNPPPLRQLITKHHGWWNLGLSRLVARQVPDELCSIQNAAEAKPPAVFLMSGRDRVVPPEYQHEIVDAYATEKRLMVLEEADHATMLNPDEERGYRKLVNWLLEQVVMR